jgi:small subunit ribosomal protein S2
VIALVDTNCDPDDADYVIPGNDDAIRSCSLIVRVIASAIEAGKTKVTAEEMAAPAEAAPAPPAAPEPAAQAEEAQTEPGAAAVAVAEAPETEEAPAESGEEAQ